MSAMSEHAITLVTAAMAARGFQPDDEAAFSALMSALLSDTLEIGDGTMSAAQTLSAEAADALTEPINRYVDAAKGVTYGAWTLIDSDVYVEHFHVAYEAHATEHGTRPTCSIVYTGEPGTESRRAMVRTTETEADAIASIIAAAYAARDAR